MDILNKSQLLQSRSDPTAASTAITKGAPVKIVNGVLGMCDVGDTVWGFALQAKSVSDSSTDPIEWQPLRKSDVLVGTSESVTVDQTYVGDGARFGTDLSKWNVGGTNDLVIVGWDGYDSTKAHLVLKNTIFG